MARLTMKFGGTSVGSPEAIAQVVEIVRDHMAQSHELAVVVSAMSGVTDLLLESASAAASGHKDMYAAINATIAEKHHAVIDALISSQPGRDAIRAEVEDLLRGHLELCEAVSLLGEATPRISDALVSYGERLSSRVIAAVMVDEGLLVKQVDSNDFIVTDNVFQNADPLWEQVNGASPEGYIVSGYSDNYMRVRTVHPRDLTNVITTTQLGAYTDGLIHGTVREIAPP